MRTYFQTGAGQWLTAAVASALVAAATVSVVSAQRAAPAEIVIEGQRIFPGSITSTRDGAVIIGSVITGMFYRAEPGAAVAKAWVPTGAEGAIFGILADDRSGTLWACNSPLRMGPPPGAGGAPPGAGGPPPGAGGPPPGGGNGAVLAYDLRSGARKGRYQLPAQSCGDIALGADGSVYATTGTLVVRLAPGGSSFQPWGDAGMARLNAIAVASGRVFIGVRGGSGLASFEIRADGSAGPMQEVVLDQPILGADGMRAFGPNGVLVPEQQAPGSRLSLVRLTPQGGRVTVLKTGFPDGAISVTQVGNVAYVLEGQIPALRDPNAATKPFHAVAVELPAQ